MSDVDPDQKLYPVSKLTMTVDALAAEDVSIEDALAHTGLSKGAISSPATRISLNQLIQSYQNAIRRSRDPFFAYRMGFRSHLSGPA